MNVSDINLIHCTIITKVSKVFDCAITFGSIFTMWFLTACMCFLEGGRCVCFSQLWSVGSYFSIAIVAVVVAFASFVVTGRAIYDSRLEAPQEGIDLNEEQWTYLVELESFSFLFRYGAESLLVYFAYYPLLVTIRFSGLLQPLFCCMPFIRFLGGCHEEIERQYEERIEMQEKRNGTEKKRSNRYQDLDEDFVHNLDIIVH